MEPADFTRYLDAAEALRLEEDRARRKRINTVGRTAIPKMESLERVLMTYDVANAAPQRILSEVGQALHSLVETHTESIGIVILPDHVFMNGVRLKLDTGMHEVCTRFGDRLTRAGVAGITLAPEFTTDSLAQLFLQLRDSRDVEEPKQAREKIADGLQAAGVRDVSLILREDLFDEEDELDAAGKMRKQAVNAYVRGMVALGQAATMKDLSIGRRRRQRSVMRKLVAMGEENLENVIALSGIRDFGGMEQGHSMNTAILAIGIGMRIGLNRRDLIRLGLSALNHDVGEAMLPPGMLDVARPLTDAEREVLETHPLAGARHMLVNYGMAQPIVERALVSAEHHEWFNGRGGYPILLRPSLHLFSRVVAVCDAFDGLCQDRPDRPAFMPNEALKLVIRGGAKRFDPIVIRVLVSVVGRYPPGSLVELDSGEWGIVLGPGDGEMPTTRPRVVMIRDPLGRWIDPPMEIDTHKRHHRRRAYLRTVVRAHNARDHDVNVARYMFGERVYEEELEDSAGVDPF